LGRVWPSGVRMSQNPVVHTATAAHVQNRLERACANSVRMSQGRTDHVNHTAPTHALDATPPFTR